MDEIVEVTPFRSVSAEKLSELISRQLLEKIVSGQYKPGNLLPPERELATAFGVSRVAVREGLNSLVSKGILSVRQGRGTTVNSVGSWNTLDPDVIMLLHGDKVFDELIQLRRILEPELAALAAQNITLEELEELRTFSDLPDSDDVEEHVERDTSFHLIIARATHNAVTLLVMSSINVLSLESRRRSFAVPKELAKAREWHQIIFDAIAKHDMIGAKQAMEMHIMQVDTALQIFKSLES